MRDDDAEKRTVLRLRFLAEAAIQVTTGPDEPLANEKPIPPDASEEMLRVVLQHAIPVLQATRHKYLVEQIQAILVNQDGQSDN